MTGRRANDGFPITASVESIITFIRELERANLRLEHLTRVANDRALAHRIVALIEGQETFGAPEIPQGELAYVRPVGLLVLDARLLTVLKQNGVYTVGDLMTQSVEQLSGMDGIGYKSIARIERALAACSLALDGRSPASREFASKREVDLFIVRRRNLALGSDTTDDTSSL